MTNDPLGPIGFIKRRVALAYGISLADLNGSSRKRQYAWPRQVAMCLARDCTGLSLARIGLVFHRDRTTVAYAIRKVRLISDTNADFFQEIRVMSTAVKQEAGAGIAPA